MGEVRITEDFKIDAVPEITERGYPVREVSQRLVISTHSLYAGLFIRFGQCIQIQTKMKWFYISEPPQIREYS